MDNSWDVFISFSSKDRDKAEIILADLEKAELRVWYDRKYILAGDRIREAINIGIRASRLVLLLASESSLASQWVMNELDAAMIREIEERRKIVIPVLLGSIKVEDLPPDIRGKNYIDLRHDFKTRYREHRTTLLNALVAISEAPDSGLKVIPVGEEAIRFILSYRYEAVGEKGVPKDTVLDRIVDAFIKTPTMFEKSRPRKKKFLKDYGRWGARQLLKFFLDHSELKLTNWFRVEELANLCGEIDLFLMACDTQELAQSQGETILMGINPDRTISLRKSRDPKWIKQ